MRRWRWGHGRSDTSPPPPVLPPEVSEVELPDPAEAREAMEQSRRDLHRTHENARKLDAILEFLKAAREENSYAEGIVELIREGR